MKKTHVFLSYRNVIKDGEYVNFEILKGCAAYLKKQNPDYVFETVVPEAIPRGTLFSSYDVAEFLNKTMLLIDKCDKFYILNNDYLNSEGYFSSIWTEAEAFIWSRYDRDMFLSAHKKKDKYYSIIYPEDGGYNVSETQLLKLSSFQNRLLRIASLDFDNTPAPGRPNYSWPYLKNSKIYFIVCDNCKSVYITEKIENDSKNSFSRSFVCPDCNNSMEFKFNNGFLVCQQEKHSDHVSKLSIFDTLELLFDNKNKYPVIKI